VWFGGEVSEFQSKPLPLSVRYLDMGPFYHTMRGVVPEDYNLKTVKCVIVGIMHRNRSHCCLVVDNWLERFRVKNLDDMKSYVLLAGWSTC